MAKKKGKAQNGRAKQKQKAQNGSTPRRTPQSGRSRAQQTLLDDDWEEDSPIHFRGFAQSAPSSSTPQQRGSASAGKLRHQTISFVSAGANSPLVLDNNRPPNTQHFRPPASDPELENDGVTFDDSDDDMNSEDIDDSSIQTNILLDVESSNQGMANLTLHTASSKSAQPVHTSTENDVLPFVVDLEGDASLIDAGQSRLPEFVHRDPSPTPSASSEEDEVVLFHGRSKPTTVHDPVGNTPDPQASAMQTFNNPPSRNQSLTPTGGWAAVPLKLDTTQRDGSSWSPAPDTPYWRKGRGKAVPRPDLAPSAEERARFEAAAPRQTRVQFSEPSVQVTASRASTSSRQNKRGRKKDNRSLRNAIVSESDGDSEAAYEDYMENLRSQLNQETDENSDDAKIASFKAFSHPSGIAGPSLVVDGKEIGEDEVLPREKKLDISNEGSLKMNTDSDWESDDEELNPDFDELSSEPSLNASDLEEDLEYTEKQQWEDEEDLRRRRIERMTDEQIARLLQKQQEFGIEGDDLLIEDGEHMSISDDGFGDVHAARAGLSDMSNSAFGRRANKHGMRRSGSDRNNFPNASALADTLDQYGDNGFDIMDYERPSLRPTKRGRKKGALPVALEMLSDDELKAGMASQWANDRDKKRLKKLEREEQRAAGVLGSAGRKGKADLKTKYPLGMDMYQVHDELRSFLQDDDLRERAFPPMDKANRKALHEVAIALQLNSKSQGNGNSRFPVIYKTARTREYSEGMFQRVLQASSGGYLSNSRKKGKQVAKRGPGLRGQGGGTQAATVRHGEVVGAGAAEISHESFGHKLMQKMGWSKGMALGKDGEGMLTPVEQRMRVGTAGLG